MRRLHKFIIAELVVLAAIGGTIWYLYGPGNPPPDAVPPPVADLPEGALPVPSGQPVVFLDRIQDGEVLRFRFLAPRIAEGSMGDEATGDMQDLCDSYALANLPDPEQPPRQVIITLSESPVELGESRPDVVQFFEAFGIKDGKCVWEMY